MTKFSLTMIAVVLYLATVAAGQTSAPVKPYTAYGLE